MDKILLRADGAWETVTARIELLNVSGGAPNLLVGSLQGIDNLEASHRLRLFQAWLRRGTPDDRLFVKAGLVDLNGDEGFYVTDGSGPMFAPTYGIGSELAATGPGGPSIYPSTGLATVVQVKPTPATYVRGGVFNAHVGDPGERGGVDFRFQDGVLSILELGYERDEAKLALATWRYSKTQDDRFDTLAGQPVQRHSAGAYLLAQRPVFGSDEANGAVAFVRAGLSDGDTGPYASSWAVGLSIDHLGGHEGRTLALGLDQARLGLKYRLASAAAGAPLGRMESHAELTFSQDLSHGVSIQPDLQYVIHPGGDKSAKNAVVLGLRLTKSFGGD